MNRERVLAFFLAMIFLMLLDSCLIAAQEIKPIDLNVGLKVEPWASWLIPTNPIILSSNGATRSGEITGVAFASNSADGFYIVAEMDNAGHLANSNGLRLANPLAVQLPGMDNPEPMVEASIYGYSDLGYVNHLYLPDSYRGNIELFQEISPSDSTGDYTGTLSIFMTYSIGNSTD